MRYSRTLHNDQGMNPRGRHSNCKYLCTNIGAPQYIRQTLTDIKEEIDSNTIIAGDLTPHSHQWTDHQNRKLIRKHILNDTLDEMDLIDIFRTFYPNAEEYTIFSRAHSSG